MRRSLVAGLLVAAVLALALWRWKSFSERNAHAERVAAIKSVVAAGDVGWVEAFQASQRMPLTEHDARWQPLFGRLLVEPDVGAIGDPEGGWERDGGDDYSFRFPDAPLSDAEIFLDGWWDGRGSIGAQIAVQREAPHRLYEATLWRGKLALIYFEGPTPDRFEVLAESPEPVVPRGYYRLAFCVMRENAKWSLRATLLDPSNNHAVLARASASDGRLGPGGYGIGVLGGGGPRSSHVTGIAVRGVSHSRPCT
ncbi:MAG: hypothetical protein ACRENU_13500 [Gemmatimonadaceae bacterium]